MNVDYYEALQVGDTLRYGDVWGRDATCTITRVIEDDVNGNIYRVLHPNGEIRHVRRAAHKKGMENKIYVFVVLRNCRWVRTETGPADTWMSSPKRSAQINDERV